MSEAILRVAVNAPLARLFDYLPPVAGGEMARAGSRVLVPFGRRRVTALVMEVGDRSDVPKAKLRRALQILDREPLLHEAELWLIRFASDYYHHPVGEVVAAALPTALRQGKVLYAVVQEVAITDGGNAADLDELGRKAPRQAGLLALLRRSGGTLSFSALDDGMPGWKRVRGKLEEKGWIEVLERPIGETPASRSRRAPWMARMQITQEQLSAQRAISGVGTGLGPDIARWGGLLQDQSGNGGPGPDLNADQEAALEAIRGSAGFNVSLLDGVTGSGKTEVYLRLIEDAIAAKRQVLVLVPEIGLTPQLVSRFENRLAIRPALFHSSLSDSERLLAWRAARDGSAPLILGTRSAVFAPMKAPGLIIVDEEHDSSFKQQEGLRYSARDLAVARAKQLNIPVVLGSATPSLESLQRSVEGGYRRVLLPTRAGRAAPPRLRLIDLRQHPAEDGLSQPALAAMEKNLAADGQVLVFLNRRGFAPTLICQNCGAIAECRRCDARMTVHAAANRLMCHHCGATRPLDTECGDCGGSQKPLGQGTQRLEAALRQRFPERDVRRIDSDSTRRKGAMDEALALAAAGDTSILVGTQMLSKGHHFPNLTLVVVIDADQGLFSTDFRGTERLAQSLVQVAGRAGREERQGEVMIQTSFAPHPFWDALLNGGYDRVAMSALEERETAGWPPFSRLALLRASAMKREDTHRFLEAAERKSRAIGADDVRVLGPVSAPMERKAGRYRAQLLIQSRNRQMLHGLLRELRALLETEPSARRVRWSIDVDPIELF